MKTTETLDMQGRLRLHLCDANGRVVQVISAPNHILLSGRDLVAKMFTVGGLKPISHLAVGTGTRAVTPDDSQLAEEVIRVAINPIRVDQDLSDIMTEDGKDKRKRVMIAAQLGFDQANLPLTEAALFNEDGIIYNRIVFDPVAKTQDFKLSLIWEITF
jgi:hypothetical protein